MAEIAVAVVSEPRTPQHNEISGRRKLEVSRPRSFSAEDGSTYLQRARALTQGLDLFE